MERQMGFVICPRCLQSVSDASDSCPNCGSPLPRYVADAPAAFVPNPLGVEKSQLAEPPFFAVSLLKFTVLSLCTFGIYELYWFFRHWKRIRARGEPTISPFWRAVFIVFYCYSCFERIKRAGIFRGIDPVPPVGVLAVCYILATISWRLPDPFSLISFLNVIFLLPVQSYANKINAVDSPHHDPNSKFSTWNWLAVVVGGLLFILAIIGTFLQNTKA